MALDSTFTVESTTKVPLIDKVAILMVSNGRGLGHWLDEFLKETKRRLEA